MISAPVVMTGRSSRRLTTSVVRVEACLTRRAISSMLTPRWLSRLTKVVRSSRGVQLPPMPASSQTRLNIFRTLAASSAAPRWVVKTSPLSCQSSPAVFAAPAPGSHPGRLLLSGDYQWWRLPASPRHAQTTQDQKPQVEFHINSGNCWPAGGPDVYGKEKVYGSIP